MIENLAKSSKFFVMLKSAIKNSSNNFVVGIIAIIFILSLNSSLSANETLTITSSHNYYNLKPSMKIFETDENYSFNEILNLEHQFLLTEIQVYVPKNEKSVLWVKVELLSLLDFPEDWFFQFLNYNLKNIDFYVYNGKDIIYHKSGTKVEQVEKEISFLMPMFKINLKPGSQYKIYAKIETEDIISLDMPFYNIKYHSKFGVKKIIIFSVLAGMIAGLFLYNLFLFFTTREIIYLFYSGFVCSFFLYEISIYGISYQYIWNENYIMKGRENLIYSCTSLFFLILLTREYFNTKKNYPVLNKLFIIFMILTIGFIIIFLSVDNINNALIFGRFFELSIVLLVILLSIISSLKKYKPAYYFLSSWLVLLLTVIIVQLINLEIIYINMDVETMLQIGAVLQAVLMSLGQADRINIIMSENFSIKIEKENIQKINNIKSNFFANISHEIRTPLTLMITPIEAVLSGNFKGSPDTSFFESIHRNGVRLINLINKLLDFSKLDAGQMNLHIGEYNMVDFIIKFSSVISPICATKGLKLDINTDSDKLPVYFDPETMEKIFVNIFSNSVKFTDSGSISISIKKTVINNTNYCTVEISDTGIGIPDDKIGIVFDRFSQADSGSTKKYQGTGIGLALTKELVELHGGNITVKSMHIEKYPDSHGSVFTINLPMGKEHYNGNSSVQFIQSNKLDIFQNTNEMKIISDVPQNVMIGNTTNNDQSIPNILVVEDSQDMHNLLNDILRGSFNTINKNSGTEVVDYLKNDENIPDLIISDVMMPVMDGYELTEKLHTDPRLEGIPIILLTAKSETSMKIEGLEKGATDYISKPFNSRELLARINSQLEMKRLRDRLKKSNEHLFAKLEKIINKNDNTISMSLENKLKKILEYINENYKFDISRENIASVTDIHHDTLSRSFKSYTGKRFDTYINDLRIEDAKNQLINTDKSIIYISGDVGFENIRTFNRIFLENVGMSPSDYRKTAK